MAYVIKGQNSEEIFELSQIYKNNNFEKKAIIDFLNLNLNHQVHNNIITYTFDVDTKKAFKVFSETKLDIDFINLVYLVKGSVKLEAPNQKDNVVLTTNMWALLTSDMSNYIITNSCANAHNKVIHTLVTKEIIDKFIELDFEFSVLLENALNNKTNSNVIMYGYSDINIKRLFFEAHSFFVKSDSLSRYLYSNKIEELFLSILNSQKKEEKFESKIHQILLDNYKSNITVKELSNVLKISENTIRAKYKNAFGKTIKSSLFEMKMFQAKAIFEKNPNITFKELSISVGYTNPHRFKKDFEKFFEKEDR